MRWPRRATSSSCRADCRRSRDDSGLCVDALGGEPGVYSKRWSGRDGSHRASARRREQRQARRANADALRRDPAGYTDAGAIRVVAVFKDSVGRSSDAARCEGRIIASRREAAEALATIRTSNRRSWRHLRRMRRSRTRRASSHRARAFRRCCRSRCARPRRGY